MICNGKGDPGMNLPKLPSMLLINLEPTLTLLMKNLARTDLSLLFKFNKHFKYNIKLSVEEYLGMRFQGYDDEYY